MKPNALFNFSGNEPYHLASLNIKNSFINDSLGSSKPSFIAPFDVNAFSDPSGVVLPAQIQNITDNLLKKILTVPQDQPVILDDEGAAVIVMVDPLFSMGQVSSGFETTYLELTLSQYTEQIWYYRLLSENEDFPAAINPINPSTQVQWYLTGSNEVNEGDSAVYVLGLAGTLQNGATALIKVSLTDISTQPHDHASFDEAIAAAVNSYSGPGQLIWDSVNQILTFISNGQPMADLRINLGIIDDLLIEGNEQFKISIAHVESSPGIVISGSGIVTTAIIDNETGNAGLYAQWDINGNNQVNEGQNVTYNIRVC